MGYPQDPPDLPNYDELCPCCGGSDENIIYWDEEWDGDEGGIYRTVIYKCLTCDETFS